MNIPQGINIQLGLTFDDVLLVPQYSDIKSRQDVNIQTSLTKNIKLNMPLISSNMDTVTEDKMAIQMARLGGIGIIHRYCSIDEQVSMVQNVKRAESYTIFNPYTCHKDQKISEVKQTMKTLNVNSFLVVDPKTRVLEGIITKRDIHACENDNYFVENYMSRNIITGNIYMTEDQAKLMMLKNRIQKLPLVYTDGQVYGLICLKDIERRQTFPNAALDKYGRLLCGAAVGINKINKIALYDENMCENMKRIKALVEAKVDVIVIDIAHGHSLHCIETLRYIKKKYPDIDVIAGNIASSDGARDLIAAGADAIKCSIGAGSICTTRIVSGHGVPQLSALLDVAPVCKQFSIPLISDGGNRNNGNIVKALAAGANTVMLGRMLAGSEESPGNVIIKNNRRVKMIRGMASFEANQSKLRREKTDISKIVITEKELEPIKFHAEGVEGYVPYSGPVADTINQLIGGIRSGLSYTGAHNIQELQQKAKFIRITHNGSSESGVHDITQS